ncbi:P68 family surface lipoprotein [Mesomycoplasma hyopneumoniae]
MNKIQKIKSKFLKSALILSTIFSVPLLSAASCYKSKTENPATQSQINNPLRYDTELDNSIDFRIIFSGSDPRNKALTKILQKWNEKPEVKNNQPGYFPAKIDQAIARNYQEDQTSLTNDLEVKQNKKLPNLTLNYPALASTLNKYGMLLDFSSQRDLDEKIKSEYDDKFLVEMKNLPGISAERIPLLPILKTSKVLLVDKPVLSYILESAKKSSQNFKIAESDQQKVKELDPQKTDYEYISKIWGQYQNFPLDQNGFDGYTFSFEKLNNFSDIVDFLSRVKKSFPDAPKGPLTEKVDFLIGFNDAAALFLFAAFAVADGNYNQSSYFRDDEKQLLNYNNLFNKSTKNYQNTKKAYEIMAKLIKEKLAGPWKKSYANDYLKNHQLVFALTSSSHYSRNFEELGQVFLRFSKDSFQFDYPVGSKSKIWKLVDQENLPENAIAKVHQILDNKPGYVYVLAPNSTSENDIILDPQVDAKLIQEIKNTIKTKGEINNFSFLSSDPDFEKWLLEKKQTSSDLASLYLDFGQESKYKLIKQSKNVTLFSKSYQKLNEDELMILPEPQKVEKSNKFNILTLQGPSLIGFHNNEKEDVATLNFVKWFISQKEEFLTENQQKLESTPADFLAFAAGNLNPTKANLNSDFEKNPLFLQNPIFQIPLAEFKKQLKNPEKYRLFSEPAGVDSNTFRITLFSTITQINNQFLQDPELDLDFDYFLEQLRANIALSVKLEKDQKNSENKTVKN